jgi:ribosomal protein S12 methylthiotransferase accessory factor
VEHTSRADGRKRYFCGTHRIRTPAETLARVKPHLRQLGITRVANVTGLDVIGIPVTMVTRPNGRSLSLHQGKGPELDAAKASGILEAAEHHVAEHLAGPDRTATLNDLEREARVVDVGRLPRSVRVRDPGASMGWAQGQDLAAGQPVWVPYEMVHVDLRLPLPAGSGFFPLGSNGLASGNDFAEAAVHALGELVERDALALFYQESVEEQLRRRLDLGTVDDDVCLDLIARFEAAGVELAVWDMTSDLGIASVFCMAVDRVFDPFRPVGVARGSGAHLDRGVALSRALCEAAQSRLTRIVGARDDLQANDFERLRSREATERAHGQMRAERGSRAFCAIPSTSTNSVPCDLDEIRTRLAARGMTEVVVVELSRSADLPFAVLRAIVPGLEGVIASPSYRPGLRAARRPEGAP